MADVETTHTPNGGTTIIEKHSGNGGMILLSIVLLIAIVVAGLYLFGRQSSENVRDTAITGAAHSVSSAADKVGGAASDSSH